MAGGSFSRPVFSTTIAVLAEKSSSQFGALAHDAEGEFGEGDGTGSRMTVWRPVGKSHPAYRKAPAYSAGAFLLEGCFEEGRTYSIKWKGSVRLRPVPEYVFIIVFICGFCVN